MTIAKFTKAADDFINTMIHLAATGDQEAINILDMIEEQPAFDPAYLQQVYEGAVSNREPAR